MLVFEKAGVGYSVEFPNRCFFCFVKLSRDSGGVSFDTSEQVQFPVNDFQKVFNHLVPYNDNELKFVDQVPPICVSCGTLLEVLHNTLNQLASATFAVKSRIKNLGNDAINKEQRLHDFSLDLQNLALEFGTFQEALNLLEKIGHGPFENIQVLGFSENISAENFLEDEIAEDGESCEWGKDEFNNDSKPEDIDWLLQKEIEKCSRETAEIKPSLPLFTESGVESSTEDVEIRDELIPVPLQNQDEVDPLSDYGILPKPENALLQAPDETPSHSRIGSSFRVVEAGRLSPPRVPAPQKKCKRLKGKPRGCDFCGQHVYVRNILGHVRSHVGEYAIPCPNPSCEVVFSNIHSLKAHSHYSPGCSQLVNEITGTCSACGHHATTIKHLRIHLEAEHETTQKLYPCPVAGCSESFTVRQSVQCHLNVHTISSHADMAPPSFQTCPDCGTHIPQKKLRKHLTTDHGILPEAICQCKHCSYLFPSRIKLINHLGIHMKAGTSISCDLCPAGDSFVQMPLLKKHYLAVHKVNSYEFVCEHCNKPFHELRSLRRHLKTHSGDIPPSSTDRHSSGIEPNGPALPVIGPRGDKFACDYCGKRVPGCNRLEHMRGHVGEYVLTCENLVCGSVFATLTYFKRHMERSSCAPFATKHIDKCELCGHQAKTIQGLGGHLKVVHETAEKPFSCPVVNCPERFTFRQTVYCHINVHATVNKKQKLAPPSFQTCPDCEQEVAQDQIREHLETIHQVHSDSIISCKYCPYLFPSRDKLLDHLAVHINSGTPVSCDMCGNETKYLHMKGLRHHYWTEHKVARARQFVCDVCCKEFKTAGALVAHAKNAHSTGGEKTVNRLKCPDCPNDEFANERALMGHNIKFHGAEPFKCQFCGNKFDSWASFVRHENEHKGISRVKVFKCDIDGCGKTFYKKKNLDYHKNKSVEHVGQTNAFVCGQCGKGYNHEASLRDHEKHVHTTERKFVCEECGESFKRAETLKRHKMIHTGVKPFQCDICFQKFRYKEVLARHVQGHEKKGAAFRPNGPMKNVRKRVNPN